MSFFTGIEKSIRKINRMKAQKTLNSQAILSKNSNAGGITISNFKLYYRSRVTKQPVTGTNIHTHRPME
jgi:hypothetical protein